jgi:hypothetical protein
MSEKDEIAEKSAAEELEVLRSQFKSVKNSHEFYIRNIEAINKEFLRKRSEADAILEKTKMLLRDFCYALEQSQIYGVFTQSYPQAICVCKEIEDYFKDANKPPPVDSPPPSP